MCLFICLHTRLFICLRTRLFICLRMRLFLWLRTSMPISLHARGSKGSGVAFACPSPCSTACSAACPQQPHHLSVAVLEATLRSHSSRCIICCPDRCSE